MSKNSLASDGLESIINTLRDAHELKIHNEENTSTIRSIRANMPVVDVDDDGAIIVENSSQVRFKVSGNGLSRRITRQFKKEEIDEINRTLPRA